MESLFVIAVVVLIAIIVTPFLLLVAHFRTKDRLTHLENLVVGLQTQVDDQRRALARSMEAQPRSEVEPAPEPEAKPTPPTPTPEIWRKSVPAEVTPQEDRIEAPAAPPPPPEPDALPATLGPNHLGRFMVWMRENWVLAMGAVSLALAGIFLVQYGAERGILTPTARVLAAMGFGAVLLAGGEVLRRRFGDEVDNATRFLPSALSGAGFLTLFASILAARALYDLVGPVPAFAGLALVSVFSILFGWFYGPLLSAVGVMGAIAAPYLVGGDTDDPWLLCYYFTLIALAGLAIDSLKRWAWLSALALAGAGLSIWLIQVVIGVPEHFMATLLILAAASLAVPERQLMPQLGGPPMSALLLGVRHQGFPTWLGFVMVANAVLGAVFLSLSGTQAEVYLAIGAVALIFLAALFWLWRAPALVDIFMLPAAGFSAIVVSQPVFYGALFSDFRRSLAPEEGPPATVWVLTGLAFAASVLLFLRLRTAARPRHAVLWGLASAVLAPVIVFLLEFFWTPAIQYGDFGWAATVLAVAAGMTVLSERSLRLATLEEPRLFAALYAAAAFVLVGLALFLMLTSAALTLALALLVLLAVAVDRRFDLPLLGYVVKIGILVITYRALADPGVFWATSASVSLADVLLAYLGTGAILFAALKLVGPDRQTERVSIDGGVWVLVAALIYVLFERLLPGGGIDSHWGLGLLATMWLVVALAQLRQIGSGTGWFERVIRFGLGGVLGLLSTFAVMWLFTGMNPLTTRFDPVRGIPFLSTLALAYLPLAAVIGLAAWRLKMPSRAVRNALGGAAVFLVIWYVALSIRHFWQGPVLSVYGITDPELYSYTLAMLIGSAGTLIFAFSRRSRWLRTVAMGGVALTVAKVFLIDMAGLTGLTRVLSFMGLGLSLLALTWLNRVMEAQWERRPPPPE